MGPRIHLCSRIFYSFVAPPIVGRTVMWLLVSWWFLHLQISLRLKEYENMEILCKGFSMEVLPWFAILFRKTLQFKLSCKWEFQFLCHKAASCDQMRIMGFHWFIRPCYHPVESFFPAHRKDGFYSPQSEQRGDTFFPGVLTVDLLCFLCGHIRINCITA